MNARELKEYISNGLTREEKEVINKITAEEFGELVSFVGHKIKDHLEAPMPQAI